MREKTAGAFLATGHCMCGAVRFRVQGPLRGVLICHCARCRRMNTHVGAFTACDPSSLEIEPTDALRWFSATERARRGFCAVCGSTLFWQPSTMTHTAISAGSIDPPTALSIIGHICVDEKADYYEIDDGLPQRRQ